MVTWARICSKTLGPGSKVTGLRRSLMQDAALVRSPMGEDFLASVWDRWQFSIMINFGSYFFVPVIKVWKAYAGHKLSLNMLQGHFFCWRSEREASSRLAGGDTQLTFVPGIVNFEYMKDTQLKINP